MATKTFVYSVDLYHQQHAQLALEDPNNFFSPLVDAVLVENDGKTAQSQDWMDYITKMGFHYNSLCHYGNRRVEDCLAPIRSWVDDERQKSLLSKPQYQFPFLIVRYQVVCSTAQCSGLITVVYDDLEVLKADRRFQPNVL